MFETSDFRDSTKYSNKCGVTGAVWLSKDQIVVSLQDGSVYLKNIKKSEKEEKSLA